MATALVFLYVFFSPKEIPIAFYIDRSSDTNPGSAYRQSLVIAMHYFNEEEEGLRRYRFVPVFLSSVDRDKIFKEVWHEEFCMDTQTVTVHIKNIRKKIKEINPTATIIETVWGIGFKIC